MHGPPTVRTAHFDLASIAAQRLGRPTVVVTQDTWRHAELARMPRGRPANFRRPAILRFPSITQRLFAHPTDATSPAKTLDGPLQLTHPAAFLENRYICDN